MSFWTLAKVAQAIAGHDAPRWLIPPANPSAPLAGVSTDTRTVAAGQVFFALRGEKYDANEFVDQAAQRGAALIVADRESAAAKLAGLASPPALLLVGDSVLALQHLASAYRDHLGQLGAKIIAIAGSNGKTTTRNLLHTVLSTPGALRGTQSAKSFNNHIGVPVTLLSARETDQFVCVEVGTNHPGELDLLGNITRPDAVVITSIGHEHMEFFKTLAGVAKEEASILGHLAPDGLAVVVGDGEAGPLLDPYIEQLKKRRPAARVVRFGEAEGSDLRLTGCTLDEAGSRFVVKSGDGREPLEVRLSLLGHHNARNALCAIAVARWLGVSDALTLRAMTSAKPVEMRLNVARHPDGPGVDATRQITVINDAYNANPDSMAAALRTLTQFPATGRRVAVLGDMRELGDEGPELHRKIGRLIGELGEKQIGCVALIGKLSLFAADALSRVYPAQRLHAFPLWDDSVPGKVAALLQPGDVVLLKASRGVGLERLLPAIQQRAADTNPPANAK